MQYEFLKTDNINNILSNSKLRKQLSNLNHTKTRKNKNDNIFMSTVTKINTKYSTFSNSIKKKIDLDNFIFKNTYNKPIKHNIKQKKILEVNENKDKILYATKMSNFKIKKKNKIFLYSKSIIKNAFTWQNHQYNKKIYLTELSKKGKKLKANKRNTVKKVNDLNFDRFFKKNEFKIEKNKNEDKQKEIIIKENKFYIFKYIHNLFGKNNKNFNHTILKRQKIHTKEVFDKFIKEIQITMNLNESFKFLYLINGDKVNYLNPIPINRVIIFICILIS